MRPDPYRGQAGDEGQIEHEHHGQALDPGHLSQTMACAMAASLIALPFARVLPAVRARYGAIERGFYLSAIAWFAVFAVACATGTG
jgi:hypothetical protein